MGEPFFISIRFIPFFYTSPDFDSCIHNQHIESQRNTLSTKAIPKPEPIKPPFAREKAIYPNREFDQEEQKSESLLSVGEAEPTQCYGACCRQYCTLYRRYMPSRSAMTWPSHVAKAKSRCDSTRAT